MKVMTKMTKMLATCWPLEQVLLVRAGHTYAQTAPYAKSECFQFSQHRFKQYVFTGVCDIITPLFLQYGQFNTGKFSI